MVKVDENIMSECERETKEEKVNSRLRARVHDDSLKLKEQRVGVLLRARVNALKIMMILQIFVPEQIIRFWLSFFFLWQFNFHELLTSLGGLQQEDI